MTDLIEAIQQAVADDATAEAKQQGAQACRAILTALDAEPGASLAPLPASPAPSPLAGMDPTQILDLVIARLRAAVAERTGSDLDQSPNPTPAYCVEYVSIPRGGGQ